MSTAVGEYITPMTAIWNRHAVDSTKFTRYRHNCQWHEHPSGTQLEPCASLLLTDVLLSKTNVTLDTVPVTMALNAADVPDTVVDGCTIVTAVTTLIAVTRSLTVMMYAHVNFTVAPASSCAKRYTRFIDSSANRGLVAL